MTRHQLTRRLLLSAAAVAFTTSGGISGAVAQSTLGKTFDEIVAGAKKEGKLVAWIVAPRSPETHKALIDAFNARFGLNTQLEWVPNAPIPSNTRALSEMASGKVSVDIIGGNSIEGFPELVKAGLIKPYPWGEVFGKSMPAIKSLEGIGLPESQGNFLAYQQIAYVMAWNPQLIADDKVPNTLAELTDPSWQGKFAFNAFFLIPVDTLSTVIGRDAALELGKKIFANKPLLEKGTPSVARAILTGAAPIGVTVSAVAEASERKKEPLKYKMFSDYIPVSTVYLYVPENSPNPNTARLFTAWLAAEGSAVGDKFEPMSRPGDKDDKLQRLIDAQVAKTGAKVAQFKTLNDIADSTKLREALSLVLSGQVK